MGLFDVSGAIKRPFSVGAGNISEQIVSRKRDSYHPGGFLSFRLIDEKRVEMGNGRE